MVSGRICKVETFVKSISLFELGHDYAHFDRVRKWALKIAKIEKYNHTELVESAALLHDVGLSEKTLGNRKDHGNLGAKIAHNFLKSTGLFNENEVFQISEAIRNHNTNKSNLSLLSNIIRDADILDSLGAIGILRTVRHRGKLRDYDPINPLGSTWGTSSREYDVLMQNNLPIGTTIVDYLNFEISLFENIRTNAGKILAKGLVNFTKTFILQIAEEIEQLDQ